MSPLQIEMLFHFFYKREPCPTAGTKVGAQTITHFLRDGLIEPIEWGYQCTEKGRLLVRVICSAAAGLYEGLNSSQGFGG